jgi:hypothetical protein
VGCYIDEIVKRGSKKNTDEERPKEKNIRLEDTKAVPEEKRKR